MSAALPPVPDLIPISALRKGSSASSDNNNCDKVRECGPCTSTQCHEEVMGEQRSRRRTGQSAATATATATAAERIDSTGSRGSGDGAAPQPQPASRKSRSERHRKSDRRRERERPRRKRSASSKSCSGPSSPERPANPRVNPIFVWVRQKDTHIVEVKCEDYDKRNRILLTKTAQGWRAIPRTETLAPALHKSDDRARKMKRRSSKSKRKSTAVQVDDDHLNEDDAPHDGDGDGDGDVNRNSAVSVSDCSTQVDDEPATPASSATPLDNLLAVAELEFNQQIKSGQWDQKSAAPDHDNFSNMEELNLFIESCAPKEDPPEPQPPPLPSPANTPPPQPTETTCEQDENTTHENDVPFEENKSEGCDECDYNEEEDESNLAMVDILSRLEQSLRSPDALNSDLCENEEMIEECEKDYHEEMEEGDEMLEESVKSSQEESKIINDVSATETPQEGPTDLSTHNKEVEEANFVDDLIPTDLSVPKCSSPVKRPASQNSETIQSPQPSGIPAVPPSPDVYNKNKPIYLDSLLSPSKEKEKEPLNLGKSRDTDSPKVTCSQEDRFNEPPPAKKNKLDDITLKTLLDQDVVKGNKEDDNKNSTPRLLELLSHDKNANPLLQLKQVLANASLNVPDPMLIPKDRLSQILSAPSVEIPKLLNERPELRLPEALAFPHLLQDPDILVITLAQLETIVQKQSQSLPVMNKEEVHKKKSEPPPKEAKKSNNNKIPELSNDIDVATNAAFAQMMWLPYLNQLENAAMSFGSNAEFLKMLTSILPGYPNPMNEMTHMLGTGRVNFPPPPSFPLHPAMNYNPIEMGMWQEAMLHARSKNQFDLFKEYAPKAPGALPKQNPYLNMPGQQGQYQNMRPNLQIPQYNPHLSQKFSNSSNNNNNMNGINGGNNNNNKVSAASNKSGGNKNFYEAANFNKAVSTFQQQQKLYENEKFYQQQRHQKQQELLKQHETAFKHQQEMYGNAQRPKVTCKPFANISHQEAGKRYQTGARVAPTGAIDLSGPQQGQTPKLKVRQHLVDQANAPRLLKHDDVPEVGSTTASIEEMQDAQKHLWHPLFGSQKGYTSPWNWTTVTATGE